MKSTNEIKTHEEVDKENSEKELALKEEKRKERAYRMASKNFFKGLEDSDYHATDIENLNGYFIFYYGKNSVVHFRIKECPGWYFGIWWDTIDEENKTVKGTFFTQYERDIDKFKPTASDHTTRIEVSYETKSKHDGVWLLDLTVSYILKYLNKHFYKAWCGYGKYSDGSELLCWYRYIKYRWYLFRDEFLTEKASKWCVKYLKKILERLYEGEVLVSKTEDQSPKYELCISYEKNKHYFDKIGNYNIFLSDKEIKDYLEELGDNPTDPKDIKLYNFCKKSKKLEKKYNRKVKHFDRIASLIGIHFISIQVNKTVNVFNRKLCNNVKKYGTWWG